MINKKIIITMYMTIMSVLIITGFVSAFGVSLPPIEGSLKLYPGQSTEILIGLQSSSDEGSLTIVPEISEGRKIAEITDRTKEYQVIANQQIGAEVHLRLSIPEDAVVGREYNIRLLFSDRTKRESGMVGVGVSITTPINVLVVENPEAIKKEALKEEISTTKSTITGIIILLVIIIIVILAIIAVILLLIRGRKR